MARSKNTGSPFSLFAFQDIITSICGIVVLITLILALELTMRVIADQPIETAGQSEEYYEQIQAEIEAAQIEIQSLENLASQVTAEISIISENPDELQNKINELNEAIEINKEKQTQLNFQIAEFEQLLANTGEENKDKIEQLKAEKERLEQELQNIQEEFNKSQNRHHFYFSRSSNIKEKPWLVVLTKDSIEVQSVFIHSNEKKNFFGLSANSEFLSWASNRDSQTEYFVFMIKPTGADRFNEIEDEIKSIGFRIGIDCISESQTIEIGD